MASGGVERVKFEEAPASFKSAVWEHFGFAVDYNDDGVQTVDKKNTLWLNTAQPRKGGDHNDHTASVLFTFFSICIIHNYINWQLGI